MKIDYKKLTISIVGTQLAGALGSVFNFASIPTWYTTLNKPSFNPPNWIFGPVWTILFLMMGIAVYLVWTKKTMFHQKKKKLALQIFVLQLLLNILWSAIFFGLLSPAWAFVEIMLLWLAISMTIIKFHKFSNWAAYLLVPYLAWVSFASILNFAIWMLNW
ncbi:MAG: TspO protein [Candidatus Magasanikbacteria bacterium CG_4_10_14_0_2_um_filter_33_14]|uniref:TspO protein n=1 Tax=Candidatus Magasanikbacteria bacterium CG_4_10_14_0_2_um_filter_33_14 TaxID=1974636 RepID=A0A2M7VAM9_9BACT|nr:MAG: TspO protein [Candidatus Magasanikbacteria bacterium CG_4_10_14_0_2_um_filter_33_14]